MNLLKLSLFLILASLSLSCDKHCMQCKRSTQTCITCDWNFYLMNNNCIECKDEGQYQINSGNRECVYCTPNCKTCKSATECQPNSCQEGYVYYDSKCYKNQGNLCTDNCEQCIQNGKLQCGKCEQYYFLYEGKCVKCDKQGCKKLWHPLISCVAEVAGIDCANSCAANEFENSQKKCQACHQSCKVCKGEKINDCLMCNSGQFLDDGYCLNDCTERKFFNRLTKQCQSCHSSCQTCVNELETKCLSCVNNLSFIDGKCKCKSNEVYQASTNSCLKCHESCETCKGGLSTDCLTCKTGDFMNPKNQCVKSCSIHEHTDVQNKKCYACHETCYSCSGIKSDQCLTCRGNQILKKGVCECSSQTFFNQKTQLCENCHESCSSCKGKENTDCLACKEDYLIINNKCVSIIGNTKMCQNRLCDLTCTQCDLCSPENCKIKDGCRCPSYDIPGGIPYEKTPQFFYFSVDDGVNYYVWDQMDLINKYSQFKDSLGCNVKFNYFFSADYINNYKYLPVIEQVGDLSIHTTTHNTGYNTKFDRWKGEFDSAKKRMRDFSNKTNLKISGSRAPYLAYNDDYFSALSKDIDIIFDSSVPVVDVSQGRRWPYTMDFGLGFKSDEKIKMPHKRLWELEMQSIVDKQGRVKYNMDPTPSNETLEMYKENFIANYKKNKAPFGMYFHPGWLIQKSGQEMLTNFMKFITTFDNIVFATESEIIQWVKNPQPVDQLKKVDYLKCRNQKIQLCKEKLCNERVGGKIHYFSVCLDKCPVYSKDRCFDNKCDPDYENSTTCSLDCMKSRAELSDKQKNEAVNIIEPQQPENLSKKSTISETYKIATIILSVFLCVSLIAIFGLVIKMSKNKRNYIRKIDESQSEQLSNSRVPRQFISEQEMSSNKKLQIEIDQQ